MKTSMQTTELLAHLREQGIRLWVEGTELKIKAPKGVLTPDLRERLVAAKRDLIELLRPASASDIAVIPKVDRSKPLPLSFTQQRLWFLDQMDPGVITYNMWAALTLLGELDVDVLTQSLNEIIRRHEVLSATFDAEGGVPHQVLHPDFRLEVEVLDGGESRWSDAQVQELLLDRLERHFDLARGPLVRATLLRRAENEHVLMAVIHHIVFDGLSVSLFFSELNEIYPAFLAGKPSPLPEPEIQYVDYAAWQRGLLEGAELERRMGYWKDVLRGDLPILELPVDKPRPAVQTFAGAVEAEWFADRIPGEIEALANHEGSTPFLVLLAAYQVLLMRLTGVEDLLIGTAMANRTRPEVQKLLGYFVNTLVLRTDLSGEPTFRELLKRVRDVFFGAVEHQDMPFEALVDEVQPERNLAYSPLFQTLFVLDQDGGEDRAMGALEILPLEMENRASRTDLVVHAYRGRDDEGREDKLKVGLEYNTDLFEAGTIQRLLVCFEEVLGQALAHPDEKISNLAILPPKMRDEIVRGRNATEASYPDLATHKQFETQADRTPGAQALSFPSLDGGDDVSLTYSELDQAANRLSHELIAAGVEHGSMVGLSLDRSNEMVIALLAILKTGAAYVPLDPSYPVDRLAYMIEHSGLGHIVTTSALASLLPDGPMRIELDTSAEAIAARSAERPDVSVSIDDRMYVIYTSGSTGRPKGVELEHRSVSNFLMTMASEPGIQAGDRLLAVTTLSFDISVLEVMLPLVHGGCVIVAPREAVGDGSALVDLVQRLRPEVMQATPATWRMMIASGWKGSDWLRVLCGGEALPRDLADEIVPRVAELWNVYGPTETTIWSSVKRVEAGDGPITIGCPIANTLFYVLDAYQQPVPIGVPGELWIGGDGLARGYLHSPDLTEERFLPDPFRPEVDGARMYRTGDKARWLPDGDCECLGRIDNQVKLRGFRIELGEIEAVLQTAKGVRQCVCVIREDTPGDQRLTAYVVPEGSETPDPQELRAVAQDKLPAYMVPAATIELAELPHTPNGKVDRKALLSLDPVRVAATTTEIVPPRTPTEKAIARVWSEILGLEEVSADVNFFDLGGHSLLLAQVRAKLKEALGADLSIIELFQFPTVIQLGTRVDAAKGGGKAADAPERNRSLSQGRKALMRRRRR